MEKTYQFQIGQKVKIKDEDDGSIVHGKVTDKTDVSIFIQWEDIKHPIEHSQEEFEKITVVN